MFPDTANFSDPAYSGQVWDPNSQSWYDPTSTAPGDLGIPNLPSGLPETAPPLGTQNQGPQAPVSAAPGSSLLGWLGLGATIANTAVNAARGGTPVTARPGTLATSGSITTKSVTTLVIIALLFVGAIFVLKKA